MNIAPVATQHMPYRVSNAFGLLNTDHRIWGNVSHVALWEILLACILGINSLYLQGSSDTSDPDAGILQWDMEDIAAWLKEIGFPHYQVHLNTAVLS